jgi:hypothetical protein
MRAAQVLITPQYYARCQNLHTFYRAENPHSFFNIMHHFMRALTEFSDATSALELAVESQIAPSEALRQRGATPSTVEVASTSFPGLPIFTAQDGKKFLEHDVIQIPSTHNMAECPPEFLLPNQVPLTTRVCMP